MKDIKNQCFDRRKVLHDAPPPRISVKDGTQEIPPTDIALRTIERKVQLMCMKTPSFKHGIRPARSFAVLSPADK